MITPTVATIDRADFLARYWQYAPGEHVTVLAPNGGGKTRLMYELLEVTATRQLPALTLAMKPRDATVTGWTRRLRHRTVRSWPPVLSVVKDNHPPGWTLWPKHTFDPDVDDAQLFQQFRRAILDSYKRGDRILYADEVLGLADLGLGKELRSVWTRGRSMGCGLWGGSQKPTHIPTWAYDQAIHLFLGYDPDARARKRFDEIGGVDPQLVAAVTAQLPKYHFLYIRRHDRTMCIVGP